MSVLAIAQMCSTADLDANLAKIEVLVTEAAMQQATAVVLPENATLMPSDEASRLEAVERQGDGLVQQHLAALARQHGSWLFVGSHTIDSGIPGRPYQRLLCYDPQGVCAAVYDKIHLFDVEISDSESYHESANTLQGEQPQVVATSFGIVGLSICFDMRFPLLYQRLRAMGAEVLLVPAAFTRPTGQAHWLPLLRARAIETQCYVLAPAQYGEHGNGRATWGHSCIIDPWGEVLAEMDEGDGIAVATIDLQKLASVRRRIPCPVDPAVAGAVF